MPERASRFGGQWGWDILKQGQPKVGDLMVVTASDSEYHNQVMRLNRDEDGWQTVTLGEHLTDTYGVNVNLYRRDVRPLNSRDKVMVV